MKAALALLLLALTPAQERGRHIYFHGESKSGGEITARIGNTGTPFSAAITPCVNCHGEDGRGRVEASVRPANISAEMLSRLATINERTRPAYTRPHLKRALFLGSDSRGTKLSPAMPRYQMTNPDAEDLLDFLQILGTLAQPGITDDAIRIGIVGDDTLTSGELRIYGRKLELVHGNAEDVFLRIDASPIPGTSAIPTIAVQSLTSTDAQQREALLDYARRIGAEAQLAEDCVARDAAIVLMTATLASHCDIASLPRDRAVIVAMERPPNSAVLGIVANLLAQLGRDVTRASFMSEFEKRVSAQRGWLMKFDAATGRLMAVE